MNQSTSEYSKQQFIINDSVYNSFSEAIYFKLDTLKFSTSKWYYFFDKFKFLALKLYDAEKKEFTNNIIYTREISELQFLIGAGKSHQYVIAVDERTGKIYKLAGFETNDFVSLTTDFIEFERSFTRKVNIRSFLKNVKVESIDFNCIYEWFRSNYRNRSKFPCMEKTSDLITVG